ncbi:MAG: TlpA family protein disulfide reductase, partial [Deltaproteobacteria bacterium]|nr:TlpA family protein disulfide reductase [Deltaproteobacteria bacterium]
AFSLPKLDCSLGGGPKVGEEAISFVLPNMEGQQISLKDFRGKVLLLNFWASWCGPCREEMPSLEALYQRYQDQDFVVLGLSLDEGGWEPVKDFLKQVGVSFPIVLDEKLEVSDQYQIFRIPETYFIDREGRIAGKIVGPQNYDQKVFYQKVERLLEKQKD